jgi:hypothetical protein
VFLLSVNSFTSNKNCCSGSTSSNSSSSCKRPFLNVEAQTALNLYQVLDIFIQHEGRWCSKINTDSTEYSRSNIIESDRLFCNTLNYTAHGAQDRSNVLHATLVTALTIINLTLSVLPCKLDGWGSTVDRGPWTLDYGPWTKEPGSLTILDHGPWTLSEHCLDLGP